MSHVEPLIQSAIEESNRVNTRLGREQTAVIRRIAESLTQVLRAGGTIYLCGNGGSAADAQHVAAELVGRFLRQRRPLPAVALTTNTSILTALANDYGFGQVFARQVRAQLTERDLLAGISTSGRSENVLLALEAAREKGAQTVGFTGSPGEPLASQADACLCVPSNQTPRIQEAHILAWHIICDLVDQAFAEGDQAFAEGDQDSAR
jgi:D-sedoheptulose 7-phosphate isomerase